MVGEQYRGPSRAGAGLRGCGLALVLVAGALAPPAAAQGRAGPTGLTGAIDEDYASIPKHRGRSLVGLLQGMPPARADLRALAAVVPPSLGAAAQCLRLEVQSFDGFYYAVGDLKPSGAATGALAVDVEGFSRHAQSLARLAGRELAPLFRAGCRADGDIVPASFGGARDALWAAFNVPVRATDAQLSGEPGQRPLRTTLEGEGGVTIEGRCGMLPAPARAYNITCSFELPPSLRREAAARLKVEWQPSGAPRRVESHRIWIAGSP